MKIRWTFILAALALALTLVLVACAGGKEEAALTGLDGKTLTEERCTQCHDLRRVESAQKTRDEWKTTVGRMVTNGAKLNEAEQEAVIGYLAETYK